MSSNCTRPSPQKQAEEISAAFEEEYPLKDGASQCIISADWWRRWVNFTGFCSKHAVDVRAYQSEDEKDGPPGAIDNADLVASLDLGVEPGQPARLILPRDYVPLKDKQLFFKRDYLYIPSSAWTKLTHWYGGGPVIARRVIQERLNIQIERELFAVHVVLASSLPSINRTEFEVRISRAACVRDLVKRVQDHLRPALEAKTCRLVDYDARQRGDVLLPDARVSSLIDGQLVLLQWQHDDGTWEKAVRSTSLVDYATDSDLSDAVPIDSPSCAANQSGDEIDVDVRPAERRPTSPISQQDMEIESLPPLPEPSMADDFNHISHPADEAAPAQRAPVRPKAFRSLKRSLPPSPPSINNNSHSNGISTHTTSSAFTKRPKLSSSKPVGFSNLGNTCYMNSGLQCLVHSPVLSSYFRSGEYVRDLNYTNPLGMKGELAKAFAELVRNSRSSNALYFRPDRFKATIGRFAPQFAGFAQHDSQEFLAFLLDGLHEDLNLITQKPYVPKKESNGRPDDVVAREAWQQHLQRNQSIIVSHFQGLYRSELTCPECNSVSVTFDPYMYLSLPVTRITEDPPRVVSPTYAYRSDSPPPRDNSPEERAVYGPAPPSFSSDGDKEEERPGRDTRTLDICFVESSGVKESTKISVCSDETVGDALFRFARTRALSSNLLRLVVVTRRKRPVCTMFDNSSLVSEVVEQVRKAQPQHRIAVLVYEVHHPSITADNMVPVHIMPATSDGVKLKLKVRPTPLVFVDPMLKHWDLVASVLKHYQRHTSSHRIYAIYAMPKHYKINQDASLTSRQALTRPMSSRDVFVVDGGPRAIPDGYQIRVAICKREQLKGGLGEGPRVYGPSPPPQPSPVRTDSDVTLPYNDSDGATAELGDENVAVVNGVYPSRPPSSRVDAATNSHHNGAHSSHEETSAFVAHPVRTSEFDNDFYAAAERSSPTPIGPAPAPATYARPRLGVHLDECFTLFAEPEQLGTSDAWYCSSCKKHQRATKHIGIWSLPTILVIQLKRFRFAYRHHKKLNTPVEYPLRGLNLQSTLLGPQRHEPQVYDLYAVTNHYGSMGYGHYTAYVHVGRKWFECDDSIVREVDEDAVVHPQAYVLFYKKRGAEFNGQAACSKL